MPPHSVSLAQECAAEKPCILYEENEEITYHGVHELGDLPTYEVFSLMNIKDPVAGGFSASSLLFQMRIPLKSCPDVVLINYV
jgi:hypothetical protein